MSSIQHGIILAGGFGTRLKSVVPDRQKVVAEVQGQPFLHLLFDHLMQFGIRHVVLCVHYLGEHVRDLIGERYKNIIIEYSFESSPLGTAGAICQAWKKHLPLEETILAMNGDSICLANYTDFQEWYFGTASRPPAGLLLTKVNDISRYGNVITDQSKKVLSFDEKGGTGAGYINAGVYLLDKKFLSEIPANAPVSLEKECFPLWINRGLKAYQVDAPFIDIGVPESYAAAAEFKFRLSSNSRSRAVLIDRDGTLIVEKVYLHDPEQVELLPGAIAGLKRLQSLGFKLCVVTNQSGVSRNYYTMQDVEAVNNRIKELLYANSIELHDFFVCPHQDQDQCNCRKPNPGLALQAQQALDIDFSKSYVIGDKECDLGLGKAIGATSILVRTGYGLQHEKCGHSGEVVVDNLDEAAKWILSVSAELSSN